MGRTLGAALITAALGGAGFLVARSYALRPIHLRTLQTVLSLLVTEITYAATPLPDALVTIGRRTRSPVGEFVLDVAGRLRSDPRPSVADAWQQGVLACRGQWALTAGDEDVLIDLGGAIGRSFADDQARHLQLALTRLARHQDEAEAEAKVHTRLWRYAGLCGAALIVLMLY